MTFSYYQLLTILARLKFFWLLICYLDINECARSPCKNGATCQDIPGSYQCKCKSGYTGRNCQTGELCVRLKNFIRYTNFHLAFIWIFLVISLSCMIIIINSFLLLYFIKQLDSVSGGLYSNKWQKRHNVVITLVTHFIAEPCFLLLLLFLTLRCHPWSRREARQHWIYLLLNRELIFNYIYRCGRVHRFSLQKRCSMSKCSRQLSMQL